MSSLVYSIRWFIGRLGLCSTGLAFSHCGELFARFNQFCMKTRNATSQQVPRKTLPYNVVQWFASRSLELCHGMGHHTALLAKFYHRPSKPLEKPKHQTKVPQFCPNINPSPYAAAPHPTCRQGRSCSTQCCHSVIPFLSPVTCPIDPNNLVTQSKE